MTNPSLVVQSVSVTIGRRPVLTNVTTAFPKGITAMLGPNGAGKSTLLRAICGLVRISGGSIAFDGGVADRHHPRTLQPVIGLMPQEVGFVPHLSVRSTLDYFCLLKGVPSESSRAEVGRVLACTRLADREKDKVSALSGGMRRRLAFAVALLGNPPVLLLDEPTTGLDPAQRLFFRDAIVSAAGDAVVVFATHQIEDVALLDCNLVVLYSGSEVVSSSSVSEFVASSGLVTWESSSPSSRALVSWRVSQSSVRNVGHDADLHGQATEPRLEEIYLGALRCRGVGGER